MRRQKRIEVRGWVLAAVAVLGVLSIQAWAKPISQQEAANAVSGWLKHPDRGLAAPLGNGVKETQLYNDIAGQPSFYVVYLNPSGFVIVPADDLVEPIIGFSPSSRFVNSDSNTLGALVRRDLANRVAAARALPKRAALAPHQVAAQRKWAQLKSDAAGPPTVGVLSIQDLRVAPLTQSQWSQTVVLDYYPIALYNYYTPPGPPGWVNDYPCGCVATVIAQLMYFWQYPTTGVGTGAFSITVDGNQQTAHLRGGDGSGGPYQWSNMLAVATPTMTTPQLEAIGALCSDAGVAVSMQYTASESGAWLSDAAVALQTTFKFSNVILPQDDKVSQNNIGPGLIGMINPNLDAASPVVLGITGIFGGHAALADGYGFDYGTLYHHLNMGWSGLEDSWYNLPNINALPVATFNTVADCLYNIYMTGSGEIISGRVLDTSGNPVSGASVSAAGTNGTVYSGNTTTNAVGIYAFAQVPSAGTFTLTATAPGHTFSPLTETTGTSTDYVMTSGNVWGADFTDLGPPPSGNLTVTILPTTVVGLGAGWNVDVNGPPWKTSGATVTNLVPGNHEVYFNTVTGWDSPASISVAIVNGQTSSVTGTYILQTGSLTVTIQPPAAVTAGAEWNVNGGAWQPSGALLSGLVVGSYTINYNTIAGWNSPASAPGTTINDNVTTSVTGTYTMQTGSLKVTIQPGAAATAGALWNVDGGTSHASGITVSCPVGNHTVNFLPAPSWGPPASQSVAVANNLTTSITGTYVQDTTPPAVTGMLPASGEWDVPVGTLITLHITDAGSGVDPSSIVVSAGFGSGGAGLGAEASPPASYETIYSGAAATANPAGWSSYDASGNTLIPGMGYCVGTGADFQILFQPSQPFQYQDLVYVQVAASDLAENAMTPYVYSFTIEARSFGTNVRVDSDVPGNGFPATATDAGGNVWVAWERADPLTQKGAIWLAERSFCAAAFGAEVPVTTVPVEGDCHKPSIAITPGGRLYVAYEVHGATPAVGVKRATTSINATNWATAWTQVGPVSGAAFSLQTAPAITADAADNVNVAGVGPGTGGVQQIGVGTLTGGVAPWTVRRVTSNASNQASPAIAEDAAGHIYVLWASTADNNLYGADSTNWATLHQVTSTAAAVTPGIATEATGNILHFIWATTAATPDIQYADTSPSGGWPATPLATGASVLDATTGISNAANPRILATGTTTSTTNARVFVVWQDQRSTTPGDTNIMFAERKRDGTFGTNIYVSNVVPGSGILPIASATNPALGIDCNGAPCAAWTDRREEDTTHIYFASAMDPVAFGGTAQTVAPDGATETLTYTDDANSHFTKAVISVPPTVFPAPVALGLAELHDPVITCPGGTGIYADGSGLYLDITGGTDQALSGWVTVTIYLAPGATLPSPLTVYRLVPPATPLDNWTWTTDLIQGVGYSASTNALTFQTQHLSSFGIGAPSASAGGGGGGGGGGCTMSRGGEADLFMLLMPIAALALYSAGRLSAKKRRA